MSQQPPRLFSWRAPALLVIAWALALSPRSESTVARAQATPGSAKAAFRDVPPDHWAYAAVERLAREGLMEGYPDGTFKGKKVVTRYDLAVVVSRILDRVGQVKAAGGTLTPEETLTVNRLANEFKAELDLLGVRVDSLEKRIDEVEKKTDRLDATLSNVHIEGFYRLENTFVVKPFNFTNYPFDKPKNPFVAFTDPGLQPLAQEAFLRFIGQPYLGGGFFKDLEAFTELHATISGPTNGQAFLNYRFSNPPIAGDGLNDFATSITDPQRVAVDKAHFKLHAKLLNFRAFSNESMTDFTDPAGLLTIDSFDTAPFSGLEGSGSYKKLSYNASILKDIILNSSLGNNPSDLTDVFKPVSQDPDDIFAYRMLYEPYKGKSNKNNMIIGGTYVEEAYSYTKKDDFDQVGSLDLQLGRKSNGYKWDFTGVAMHSDGPRKDPADDPIRNLDGDGYRVDASYQFRDLTATLKGYRYDTGFRAVTAQSQFVDTALPPYRDNFGRGDPTTRGEELVRSELKYDFKDKLARIFEDLNLSGLFELKDWRDPVVTGGIAGPPARRERLQALADLTDKTHSEFAFEHQDYDFPHETGTNFGTFSVDVKVTTDTSAVGNLGFINDYDSVGPDGHHYAERDGKFTLNSQINHWLFLSPYVGYTNNALLRSFAKHDTTLLFQDDNGNIIRPLANNIRGKVLRPQRNGLDLGTIGGESNVKINPKVSLKVYAQREDARDAITTSGLSGITDTATGELTYQFTRALRLRYAHSIQNIALTSRKDDWVVNNFAELKYDPTPKTELTLTYGYEYENPDDRFDDGPLLFYRTEKLIQLRGQTDF